MGSFAVEPNYKNIQVKHINVAVVEGGLPAVTANGNMKAPSKILLRAPSSNTSNVFVGPAGVLIDGTNAIFEIEPGGSAFLLNHLIGFWKHVAADANQDLKAIYMEGVF